MITAEDIIRISESLDDTHVPEIITVDIKTKEEQMFWFNMILHGYVSPKV